MSSSTSCQRLEEPNGRERKREEAAATSSSCNCDVLYNSLTVSWVPCARSCLGYGKKFGTSFTQMREWMRVSERVSFCMCVCVCLFLCVWVTRQAWWLSYSIMRTNPFCTETDLIIQVTRTAIYERNQSWVEKTHQYLGFFIYFCIVFLFWFDMKRVKSTVAVHSDSYYL